MSMQRGPVTCICMMRSSTVSRPGVRIFMISLDTFTSRICPNRWLLAMACTAHTTSAACKSGLAKSLMRRR